MNLSVQSSTYYVHFYLFLTTEKWVNRNLNSLMTSKQLLDTVTTITKENIEVAKKHLSKLSEKQLDWIPNTGVWSVRQVLAHLNEYSRYYHPVFTRKIENTKYKSTKEGFMSSPLGRSAWKSMKLGRANNVKRKFRARKDYNPAISTELIHGNEVDYFIEQQEILLQIIKKSESVNLKKVKVPISISKIVRLRLGDALLFVGYHDQRHIQQISNLKNNPNFPKK